MTKDPVRIPDQARDEIDAASQTVWDGVAANSDYGNLDTTELERQAWTALLTRMFPSSKPLRIVDVGCGPGFMTLSLAQLGHSVIGFDISPEMLRRCQESANARGLSNVELLHGTADVPPADIAPVDAVISRHVLWTLPRPEAAVTAWAELTKPGGRILSIDCLQSPEFVRDTEGADYLPPVRRLLPMLYAHDLEPVRNVWRRAGLINVMAEELTWLDEVLRAEAPLQRRLMQRNLTLFLVEGQRPHWDGDR